MPASLRLDHVVLEVEDPERSVAFYARTLGLRPLRLAEFRRGKAPFPSARVDASTVLDFFPRRMWRGSAPAHPNHFCLALSEAGFRELERRLARARIAVVRRDDHNFGARGYGRALYFHDPDGLLVEARFYPRRRRPRAAGARRP